MQDNNHNYPTGAVLKEFDHRDIPVTAFEVRATKRPSKFRIDLSKIRGKNQLNWGSCVGQAETTTVEIQQVADGVEIDLSPRDLYGQCKLIDNIPAQGTNPAFAAKIIASRGIATKEEVADDNTLPYEEYIKTTNSNSAILSRQAGYATVPVSYSFIADQIAKGRAVSFTTFTTGVRFDLEPATPATYDDGAHRMTFIGYEDISDTDGILEWVNSWGEVGTMIINGKDGTKHGCNRILFSQWQSKLRDLQVYTDIPNKLIDAARAASKDFSYTFNINLKFGAKSDEVYKLQTALLLTGDFYDQFYGDQLQTNYFGKVTEKSVKRFQARAGLPVTGYFGPMTRSELNSQIAKKKLN